jgi:ADP-heptose:LPS heptosyltransferase
MLDAHGVVQLGHEFEDFADTAAVVAMLDLLISVDTSVAHLAGAMGKAVALLVPFSPDWRWQLDRTNSRWYPSMRLFRQAAPTDWEGVIERVSQELTDAAQRPAKPS